MLATGGGLVFSGGTNDRMFRAFDAASGKLLWEFPTNSGIIGQPSSFMVDGKQYIAVQSGWGIDARAHAGAAEPHVARQLPGGARGRRGLGVCRQVALKTCLTAEIAEIAEKRLPSLRYSAFPAVKRRDRRRWLTKSDYRPANPPGWICRFKLV